MRILLFCAIVLQLAGCAGFGGYGQDRNLTVGTVQREIRIGMSGAEVAMALGSPNIVSTDEFRNEVWIYDKISSSSVETQTLTAPATLTLFEPLATFTSSSANSSSESSERTLTVIIKFDENQQVYDFAYHTSRF
jgi:outer membrane protein assembly factor BamE (lipoprotein component of BamABCDE complex)